MEQEKKEVIFADGMIFKKPHEKAPEFIKGNISIKSKDFVAFLKKHTKEDGWVNLDLKKSREGKLYLALNTFSVTKEKIQEVKDDIFGDETAEAQEEFNKVDTGIDW